MFCPGDKVSSYLGWENDEGKEIDGSIQTTNQISLFVAPFHT